MADIVYPGGTAGGPINGSTMPSNYDLKIRRGDYIEFFMLLKNSGVAVDLTGLEPTARLRTGFNDPAPISFTCTKTGVTGEVRVFLSSTETSNLLSSSSYIWDFKLTNTLGEVRTYMVGDVEVEES